MANKSKISSTANSTTDGLTFTTSNTSAVNTIGTCSNYTTQSISTANPFVINSNYGLSYDGFSIDNGNSLTEALQFFTEKEVREFLDKLQSRCPSDTDYFKSVIKALVRNRHFSEQFLLDYIGYVEVYDLLQRHSADIHSQEYANVALIIEGKKLC